MNATLQTVWFEHESIVLERIAIVEEAIDELIAGGLSDYKRERARRAAHMLAGSVGMFGFNRSSQAALMLETAFGRYATPDDVQAHELAEQLAIMRAEGLEPPKA
ncbi:MAG TPA: Hpt domain-containing protein [Solirubrobacteraceae bacterium]